MESLADTRKPNLLAMPLVSTDKACVSMFRLILAKRGICMLLVQPFRPPYCATIRADVSLCLLAGICTIPDIFSQMWSWKRQRCPALS